MPITSLTLIKYCFVIFILALFTPVMSSALNYIEIPTSHFIFYFHLKDKKIIEYLIENSEKFRIEIVKDLGVDFMEKTKVYLAPSFRQYQELQPGGEVPSWSAAVAYPDLNLIIMQSPRAIKGRDIDLSKIFKHEFTHIALGKVFRNGEKILHRFPKNIIS